MSGVVHRTDRPRLDGPRTAGDSVGWMRETLGLALSHEGSCVLSDRDMEFCGDMSRRLEKFEERTFLSDKQEKWLSRIDQPPEVRRRRRRRRGSGGPARGRGDPMSRPVEIDYQQVSLDGAVRRFSVDVSRLPDLERLVAESPTSPGTMHLACFVGFSPSAAWPRGRGRDPGRLRPGPRAGAPRLRRTEAGAVRGERGGACEVRRPPPVAAGGRGRPEAVQDGRMLGRHVLGVADLHRPSSALGGGLRRA